MDQDCVLHEENSRPFEHRETSNKARVLILSGLASICFCSGLSTIQCPGGAGLVVDQGAVALVWLERDRPSGQG